LEGSFLRPFEHGGEKLKDKRQKETNHKQEGLQGKGKGETVENRRCASSKGLGTAGKARRGEGVGGEGGGGGVVKKVIAKCQHTRRRSTCIYTASHASGRASASTTA
jgi:hypothetical protein